MLFCLELILVNVDKVFQLILTDSAQCSFQIQQWHKERVISLLEQSCNTRGINKCLAWNDKSEKEEVNQLALPQRLCLVEKAERSRGRCSARMVLAVVTTTGVPVVLSDLSVKMGQAALNMTGTMGGTHLLSSASWATKTANIITWMVP